LSKDEPEIDPKIEENISEEERTSRKMGKATLALETKKLELKTRLAEKKLEADTEIRKKQIEAENEDKKRDDRRALIRTIGMVIATLVALGLFGLAFYFGRNFDLTGFGFHATAGVAPDKPSP